MYQFCLNTDLPWHPYELSQKHKALLDIESPLQVVLELHATDETNTALRKPWPRSSEGNLGLFPTHSTFMAGLPSKRR